ncbi:MAG TPA: VF530 family protein [Polyangiales bacterium]|nr:VF530 family protein [Polyangiales bacterium]
MAERANDPLHGLTLKAIVERLVEHYGFEKLGMMLPYRCFQFDASVASSLKFLRRTPWARKKVEELYVALVERGDLT